MDNHCNTSATSLYQSATLPLGTEVPDNLSPTLRSRIAAWGRTCVLLDYTDGSGCREVSYSTLETMVYGV